MAEIDFTNIAAASIATPSSGVLAVYSELTSPAKRLSSKNDAGTVINYVGQATTDTGANRLANKDLEDATTNIVDEADTTKKLAFSVGGATTATVLTLAENQSTSQTISFPNVTGAAILITDLLAQNITGVKTMTNMTTAAGTTGVPSMTMTAGTNMTSPSAGVQEFDGVAVYNTVDTTNGRRYNDSWHLFRLAANGSAANPITDFFGATSAIPTVLNGVYEIEWHCYFAIAALGGTVTWTITNTQAVTNMVASYLGNAAGGLAAVGTPQMAGVVTQTAAGVALPVTGTLTITTNHYYVVKALIEAGTAGNVRLRFTCGATTTLQPLRGSYYKVRRLPAGNAGTFVA